MAHRQFYPMSCQDIELNSNISGIATIDDWHTKGHPNSCYPISCQAIKQKYPEIQKVISHIDAIDNWHTKGHTNSVHPILYRIGNHWHTKQHSAQSIFSNLKKW